MAKIENATANELQMIEALVGNLKGLAQDLRNTPPALKSTRAYGRTFGRYIEAKWALGYLLCLVEGVPWLADERSSTFEFANAHLQAFEPNAQIFDHTHSPVNSARQEHGS